MFSNWAYILIGKDKVGKTLFQRRILWHLCDEEYERLPRNIVSKVKHRRAPRTFKKLFTMNRSYQEKESEYKSIDRFFEKFFKDADVCALSSHVNGDDIAKMIGHLKRRYYNAAGVFWSNGTSEKTSRICASLPWDEVIWIDNPHRMGESEIRSQIDRIANHFAQMLVARAYFR